MRQAQQRKDANVSRQALVKERERREYGDPIRGVETDFVRSFDAGNAPKRSDDLDASGIDLDTLNARPNQPPSSPQQESKNVELDHGLTPTELEEALQFSTMITEPIPPSDDITTEEQQRKAMRDRQEWESRSTNASEAIQRIVRLDNGSNMHRTKKNVERIVEKLGRHTTEGTLKPRVTVTNSNTLATTPRAGPDTGSSEVQIGILTAKIRILADRYGGEAKQDKVNKRNLRLLLHRRQKLLKYMERTERGSERWTHMLKTLGLTPATWRGEINVE